MFQEWKSSKLETAKEHVYDHFKVYLYQCQECRDVFRRQIQLDRHAAIHARRRKQPAICGEEENMVGNYHLATEASYLAWREAKPVIDTYLKRLEGGQVQYLHILVLILGIFFCNFDRSKMAPVVVSFVSTCEKIVIRSILGQTLIRPP